MSKKNTLDRRFKGIHRVFLFNHLLNKMMMFLALLAGYACLKAMTLWLYPTVLFHQYEKGILSCLGFYVLLQILKSPPRMKSTLKCLDGLLAHNRASSYWQFKEDGSDISMFLIEEISQVAKDKLKPLKHYVKVPYTLIMLLIVGGIGVSLFNNLPSSNREILQERLAYNEGIKEELLSIEETMTALEEKTEHKKIGQIDTDKKLDTLKKDLIADLKKTYSKDGSLRVLSTYDKEKQGLLAQASSAIDNLPERDQAMAKEELEALKNDQLRDKVIDALTNREEQQSLSKENGHDKSLKESFTELMSQPDTHGKGSSSETLEIASETTGGFIEGSKDGQGGSGSAYKGQVDTIEEGLVYRDEKTSAILEDNESTLQISGKEVGQRHLLYGQDIKTDNSNLDFVTNSKGENILVLKDLSIEIPEGIPQNRLNLIQAYYKGVHNE
jgi:hypothetical protein